MDEVGLVSLVDEHALPKGWTFELAVQSWECRESKVGEIFVLHFPVGHPSPEDWGSWELLIEVAAHVAVKVEGVDGGVLRRGNTGGEWVVWVADDV